MAVEHQIRTLRVGIKVRDDIVTASVGPLGGCPMRVLGEAWDIQRDTGHRQAKAFKMALHGFQRPMLLAEYVITPHQVTGEF